ncbi:MAG: DinB family protein [Chloroflexota bacterium]
MLPALLIDVDDTLLDTDIERFLPAYLQRLGQHLNHLVPSEPMIAALMRGAKAMLDNLGPLKTLHQAFGEIYYPTLHTTEDALRPALEAFYRDHFPDLRHQTRPRPQARALIAHAFASGTDGVIATNPLFPRTAIEQRLTWAEIPASEYPYALITHYENMHFAKPRPEYLAEVLGLLARSPIEAAMIGNNPADDLGPARLLGMAVFHVGEPPSRYPHSDLTQARLWLSLASSQTDPQAAASPPALLAMLRGDLAALHTLSTRLEPAAWHRRPAADVLAPAEILCHLRDVEVDVNLPRLEAILGSTEPFFHAVDTDRWIEQRGYLQQDGMAALMAFGAARQQLVAQLDSLELEAWERRARHALLGPTTLAEMVRVITDHDRLHLAALRASLPQPRLD